MPITITQAPPSNVELVDKGWHEILDQFSDERLDLSAEDIQHIVDFNNRLIADAGEPVATIVIGHTDEEAPETEQPPVVGVLGGFRVASFGNLDPRPVVEARLLMFKGHEDVLTKYPTCSVEIFGDGRISPLSLLGASAPHRPLGLMLSKKAKSRRIVISKLSQSKDGVSKRRLQAVEETNMDREELVKLIQQCMEASPIGQYVKKMMEEEAEDQTALEEGEEQKPVQNDAADGDGGKPVQQEAEAGAGGAPNTNPPSFGEPDKQSKLRKGDDAVRLERDQLAIRLRRLESQIAQDRAAQQATALKLRRTEREKQLAQLSYEGYVFDPAEELAEAEKLDDAAFGRYVTRLKKNYRRDPVGASPVAPEMHVQLSHEGASTAEKLERDASEADKLFAQIDVSRMSAIEKSKKYAECLKLARSGKVAKV